ncbi:MAG: glycoside hydrolase family 3 N-terminal domain-containing protein [Ruthenibacterium sp.]
MVDLRKSPYYLSDEDIMWVHCTIEKMTLDEKIGQLFVQMGESGASEERIQSLEENYHQGGLRYQGDTREHVADLIANYQKYAKLPLLVASNCDNGGDGAYKGGTFVCSAAGAAASKSRDTAYQMGVVAAREAGNVGCNWLFNPCVDILMNWRNTIVNTRCFGDTADGVIENARAFIRGVHEGGLAVCCKHFPGDGEEELDQHLVLGTNNLSAEDWRASYGKVYEAMIEEDIEGIMVGHFAQRALSREFAPGIRDEEIMPATLSPELLQGLLRKELGFNGLVITDASHMAGIANMERREVAVPKAIASGCDMFLFSNRMDEDFMYMKRGYENGMISERRLYDALMRILGLKAKLQLHRCHASLKTAQPALDAVCLAQHSALAQRAAQDSITLVKDTAKLLPINPTKYPRARLYYIQSTSQSRAEAPDAMRDTVAKALTDAGFSVTIAPNFFDLEARAGANQENIRNMTDCGSVEEFKSKYDVVFVVVNVHGYAQENNVRLRWSCNHSNELPWYATEVPTIGISLNYTTHLIDLPQLRTFINAYGSAPEYLSALTDKICGKSPFEGTPSETVFCNRWETRL